MKLHVCCGEVYLIGWHNIDIYIPGYSFLASERPDLVKINATTLDNYYKYEYGKHPVKCCVVDEFKDVRNLDYPDESCSQILMVSAFEHFSLSEARKILKNFYRMLKPGGRLMFDVPDIEACLEEMRKNRDIENLNWQMRLIYGSQKNEFSFHKWGYTRETLLDELKRAGFSEHRIKFGPIVKHFYPMIGVTAIK